MKATTIVAIVFIGLFISFTAKAQNNSVGIGTTTPDSSALLEIETTTQGLLVPRMTALERLAIPSPADALMVYDTDSTCFFFYKKPTTTWINLCYSGTVEVDADTTNELQLLATSGDTIFISNGNYILIPGLAYVSALIPPCAISASLSRTDETYTGANDGSITVTANCSGNCGTKEYTLNGGMPQASSVFTGLPGGTYTVVASNVGETVCSDTTMITVGTTNCAITSSLSKIDETYTGANDGSITVTASCSGTCGTLEYSLDGGTPQASNVFNGLNGGTYTIVSSNVGNSTCSDTTMITVGTTNCAITSSLSKIDETYTGANDGSITVTASCSGTCGTLEYALDGGTPQANNVFDSLAGGTYTVVSFNVGNAACSDTTMITVSTTNCAITSSLSKIDETYTGANDGSIIVNANCSGTCGTVEYSLDGGTPQASNVFTGLAPGTYTLVSANDGNATCSDTNSISILASPFTIQQLLDSTETPLSLFIYGVPLDSLYGKSYEGGLIFYLNTTTGDGLVTAPSDQSAGLQWYNGSYIVIGATYNSLGLGQSNTDTIIAAQGVGSYAAYLCDTITIGSYSDWFLPSKDELHAMYLNLGANGLGGFTNGTFYWSSSERDSIKSWVDVLDTGFQDFHSKESLFRVRAVHAFLSSCAVISSLSKTDETSRGYDDGSITVTASCSGSCGTLEYSLDGGTPQASDVFTGLAPGTYTVVASNVGNTTCSSANVISILAGPFGTVEDVEGNEYNTTKIGTQTWMAENLRTTKYNDGTPIPLVTDDSAWDALSAPGYCFWGNDEMGNSDPHGALYNYYVVADTNSLNVCPEGWHVPTDDEWATLGTYLGGNSVAGGKMKQAGTLHWYAPNTGATNESGFTGLSSGVRSHNGTFSYIGFGYWWSSSEFDALYYAWFRLLVYDDDDLNNIYSNKGRGLSVRCLRD